MKSNIKALLAIFIVFVSVIGMGMSKSPVNDSLSLYNSETVKLATQKNQTYQKVKAKPEIQLISLNSESNLNKLKAKKNQILIATAHAKNGRNNVQIIAGANFKSVFTTGQISNIIRYAGNDLRSSNNKTFNKGIRTVFNASATLVDQKYQLPGDKNTLTQSEIQKLNHPQSVNFVWGLIIVIVGTGAFAWYQRWRIKS